MTTTVTMLQTRLGESGSLWTVGNSYAASDAFAAVLISSNLATGTLPKSRSLVPLWGQTDTTGAVTSVVDGGGKRVDLSSGRRMVGYENEQPGKIAAPCTNFGKLAAHFSGSIWSTVTGAPALTADYTGWDGAGNKSGITSRTGQPSMLKVVPAANTVEEIQLTSIATNMLTRNLAGKIGLWVYVDALPGYQVGGTPNGSITIDLSTTSGGSNGMYVAFNSNQVREGWNFLKFVQRDPSAYLSGASTTEYHPFGVVATAFGTGADTNIVSGTVNRLRINWTNMLGATLYFDSFWTDFASKGQVVFGNDAGVGLMEYAKPIFDSYGWVGYTAFPYNSSGTSARITDLNSNISANGASLYGAGWDFINHTANHPAMGALTTEAQIAYEIETAKAWQNSLDFTKGAEFYASPQSSTSRLSEKVIKGAGIKLQRHVRKWNVSVTPFGIDNPQHLGAIDMGHVSSGGISSISGNTTGSVSGWQTATKIKRAIDVIEAYGDTLFPFWHGITVTGDTGTGEDLTGDNLLLTKSAFENATAYVRSRELAGGLTVCRGMSGFYYGEN
jgi:peptidoglycan/xylan/chitin deacetylase (PgdA/CDA1 family)